jgi:hypothetical protein
MTRAGWRRAVGAGLVVCAVAGRVCAACGEALPAPGREHAEAAGLEVAFVPRPLPVVVGRHFELDVVVCAPPGRERPAALRVDADMPAHRHGMNYRASVEALGDGRFAVKGLMFHMPGRWRFIFDLGDGAQPVRVTREVDVE